MEADRKDFDQELDEKINEVEAIIKKYLPREEGYQKSVIEAMNYSITAGGKRLRPLLMLETFRLFGGEGRLVEPFMAAIEMIHTYSLVHDDLPSMDNDDYRRGKLTTWRKFGEGLGVLAGDALLNYAFETALKAFDLCENYDQTDSVMRSLIVLFGKAGIYGMIGGQTVDVESEKKEEHITMDKLMFIHSYKTAALIEASMMAGAILAGEDDETVENVRKCAYDLGIAFQIEDDILDVVGDPEELGKPVGSDEENNKQTYVTLKGMEEAQGDVELLSGKAVDILEKLGGDSVFLRQLFLKLIDRRK